MAHAVQPATSVTAASSVISNKKAVQERGVLHAAISVNQFSLAAEHVQHKLSCELRSAPVSANDMMRMHVSAGSSNLHHHARSVPETALELPGVPERANSRMKKKQADELWIVNPLVVILVPSAAAAVRQPVLKRTLDATAIRGDVAASGMRKE